MNTSLTSIATDSFELNDRGHQHYWFKDDRQSQVELSDLGQQHWANVLVQRWGTWWPQVELSDLGRTWDDTCLGFRKLLRCLHTTFPPSTTFTLSWHRKHPQPHPLLLPYHIISTFETTDQNMLLSLGKVGDESLAKCLPKQGKPARLTWTLKSWYLIWTIMSQLWKIRPQYY